MNAGMRQIALIVFVSITTWVVTDHFGITPRKVVSLFTNAPVETKPVRRSVPSPVEQVDSTLAEQRLAVARLEAARRHAADQEAIRREADRNQRTLATLMDTCRYWSSQPQDRYANDMRVAACNRARSFAAENRLDQPIQPRTPSAPVVTQSTARSTNLVWVNECGRQVGSIEYRRCRAKEARRLQEACRDARSRAASAGVVPDGAYERAREICQIADRYAIVK